MLVMERAKGSKMRLLSKDCGPKCKSKGHARELVSACTKGSTRQLQLYLSRCHNTANICDKFGINALHMAASKGKWEIVLWLLEEKKMDQEAKDLESGWTALHRALFYGQIATARILMSCGANLEIRDKDDLGPLDMIMKDRLPHVQFTSTGLYEAHSWGDNLNSTLGHNSEQRKRQPEIIDFFRKNCISIKDVAMSKYHTVFLSADGKVYSCGHGQGGRLGHGNQLTYLTPKLVETIRSQVCEKIAAARDHTLFLMENGNVYSCGHNDSQQLGVYPPPDHSLVPKLVDIQSLKGKSIRGICAQRFHSVLYTDSAVYTFGLIAGQIGHLKVPGELLVTQPRMVSAFNYKYFHIKYVTASDAATAVATTKGDIYVLHRYQCRKVATKWLDIQQIAVSGGHLDHSTDLETLREKGGYELILLLLNSAGKVYLWRESDPKLKRCVWSIKRPLQISHVSLSVQNFVFVTGDGEAFKAIIPEAKSKEKKLAVVHKEAASSPPTDKFTMTVTDLVEREEVQDISVEKVPLVHRAVRAVVDKKGNNFACLQAHPNASLTETPTIESKNIGKDLAVFLEEANEFDFTHDVILEVGKNIVPAHQYILAYRSEYFRKLFTEKKEVSVSAEKLKVTIENVKYDMFMHMMKYIYTDTCAVLEIDTEIQVDGNGQEECRIEKDAKIPEATFEVRDGKRQAVYEVYNEKRRTKSGKGDKKETQKTASNRPSKLRSKNPVTLLQQMALRFGVKNLSKKLEAVKWVEGRIEGVQGKHIPSPNPRFDRTMCASLYDVCIKGEDGRIVQCHKCILVARLEYFRCMLGSGWVETSNTESLMLPIPGDILNTVITFLYTDEAEAVEKSEDVELLCNTLVVADQLLISRLKHICEAKIATLLVLKNVCEVLEFSSLYNANRLKKTCQQFICLNLGSLLETRSLDILSDDVVEELTTYYRNMVPGMDRRLITPFDESPSIEYLEQMEADYEGMELSKLTESHLVAKETPGKKPLKKTKKKRSRTKSSGEESDGQNDIQKRSAERQISVGSETQFPLDTDSVTEESLEHSPTEKTPRLVIQVPKLDLNNVWNVRRADVATSPTDSAKQSQVSEPNPTPQTPHGSQTFREIMEEELRVSKTLQQKVEMLGPIKRKPKISNNEKRRLAKQRQLEEDQAKQATSPESNKTKTAWSGWGSPPVSAVVTSFKDLMLDDEKSGAKPKQTTSAHNTSPSVPNRDFTTISWGLPQPGCAVQRPQQATSPVTPTSPNDHENPWTRRSSESQTIKFSAIVEDEIQQTESFVKATNKPLALIQIEEQAMQELMFQYAAQSNIDEYITVRRISRAMATPMWRATSHRH